MYETKSRPTYTDSTNRYRESRTTGGLVAYLLFATTLAALLVAPTVVFGAALGVVGLTLARRVLRRLRRRGRGLSPPEQSGRPTRTRA
jgi:hypothetical protein